jgi:RNA recognition motif-containing protein
MIFLCLFAKGCSFWIPQQVDCTGFAFVYMEDERDAEDAIRRLDRVEFGRKGRRLRVEWTKV